MLGHAGGGGGKGHQSQQESPLPESHGTQERVGLLATLQDLNTP